MSVDPYSDSLDTEIKISAHPDSLLKDKRLTSEDLQISADSLRKKFNSSLEKLTQTSTLETGITQIQQLVKSFRNQQCLRIYLSILKGLKKKPSNSYTMEAELVVIGYICRMYGQRLIDTADKPPSLLKTTFKFVQLTHTYFIDSSQGVSESAAKTLIEIQKYVLKNQTVEHQVSLIFTPLITMLSTGIQRSFQYSAIFCINKLVQHWKTTNQPQIIKRVQGDILQLVLKLNIEFYELFYAISLCFQISGIQFLDQKIQQFINKILSILQQNTNQSTFYQHKVLACKILQQMAGLLKQNTLMNLLKPLEVLSQLQKVCKSRLLPLQSAANSAVKAWRFLLNLQDSIISQKPRISQIGSLKEMRQRHKEQKSKQKSQKNQTRSKLQQQLNEMEKDLQQSIKDKWAISKGKQYIKKGTGIGGGQTGKYVSTNDNKGKSYQNQIKELKNIIQGKPKSPKKQIKNTIPDNDTRAIDIKVNIEKLKSGLKQPQPTQYYQNYQSFNRISQQQFTLQANHDESLSFQISKSQSHVPQFSRGKNISKNKNSPQKQFSQNRSSRAHFLSKTQLQQIINNSQYSDVSSNISSMINSNDIINSSKLSDINSSLGQSIIQQEQNRKTKLSQKNMIKKTQQRSQQSITQSEANRNKQVQKYLQLQLSKMKQEEDYNSKMFEKKKKQVIQLKPQPSKFDTLNQYKKYQQSEDEEVESEYQQSFQPAPIVKKPNEIEKQLVQNLKQMLSQPIKQNTEPKPFIQQQRDSPKQPPKKQITLSKQTFNVQIKPSTIKQKSIQIQEPIQIKYQVKQQKINQPKIQESQASQKFKNYQKLIERPPSFAQNLFKSDDRTLSRVPSRLTQQQHPTDDGLLQQWKQILLLSQNNQIQQAYERVFLLDDFIYFLRLLITTGPCFEQMTASTAKRVVNKLVQIKNSNFFQILMVGVLGQASELGIVSRSYNIQQMGILQKYLYELSGRSTGKLSYSTAMLYNEIDKQFKQ